jgi:hypothetical protein
MGFQYQGLSSNVTISGSVAVGLPQATTSQTIVPISGTGTGSAATVYTVTAGKKLAIFSIMVTNQATSDSYLYKPDGTTAVAVCSTVSNVYTAQAFASIPFWIYSSGETVKFKTGNATNFVLTGIEY